MSYIIIENNITVGRFENEMDRDKAFNDYFVHSERFAMKGEGD